jgi:uncharacterized protein (DUF885 family)
MRRVRWTRAAAAATLLLVLLASAAGAGQPAARPDAAPPAGSLAARRAALQALLDEQWQYTLRTNPELASLEGDRRWNDQVKDLSLAAIERDLAADRAFLARFEAIDTRGFPEQEALNQRLMVRDLREEQAAARFKQWEMPVSQEGGIQLGAALFPSMLSYTSAKDYDDLVARYRKLPESFDATIDLMRRGMADGRMPPRVVLDRVARQIAGGAAWEPEDSPFAKPLAHFPPGVTAAEQDRIRTAMLGVIRDVVLPAYRRFADFFAREYLPRGRAEPGVWALPDGDALYAFEVRSATTSELTPEQIHQLGLAQVAAVEREMTALAVKLGLPDLQTLDARVRSDPALRVRSGQQLLDLYRGYLAGMYAKLPRLFGRLPKAKLEVEPTEALRARDAPTANYQPPPMDGSRPGVVQVNLSDATERKTIKVEATAYHEGVPGHHLQIAIAQELPALPRFRQNGSYTAFAEGWALYAERLGKEVGLYADPYSDYGRLQGELLRAIRLVVDTGLHARRWSRAQVVQYFHQHSAADELEVQSETDRYIAWPAQALAYKIGQLKILELRERAERQLGARFDLRAFHDELLGAGALPLDVLEERMDAWLAAAAGR